MDLDPSLAYTALLEMWPEPTWPEHLTAELAKAMAEANPPDRWAFARDWIEHWSQPERVLADPDSHPVHRMYAAINIGVRDRGERWSKCANCGLPYQLTENWGNDTVCSGECSDAYVAYLNNPDL